MTIVITSKANQEFARKQVEGSAQFVSPTHKRAIHGADRVVIIGMYPHLERRYQGICPVQVIPVVARAETEIIEPDG